MMPQGYPATNFVGGMQGGGFGGGMGGMGGMRPPGSIGQAEGLAPMSSLPQGYSGLNLQNPSGGNFNYSLGPWLD
jgi:hypothetical protein